MKSKIPFATSAKLLNLHFERRRETFPGLSKRWLAQKMKISPSFLTAVFAGKKVLPFQRVRELKDLLAMDAYSTRELHFQILREMGLDQDLLSNVELTLQKDLLSEAETKSDRHVLNKKEHFFLLEKWYFLPLLDLVSVLDFRADPLWIAGRLGIHEQEASHAWRLLIEAGLVQENSGRWARSDQQLRFPAPKADPRLQKFHLAMLEKIRAELTGSRSESGFGSRLVLSATAASDPESFERAKRLLEESLVRAVEILNEGNPEKVYGLTVGLIPVS